MSANGRLLFDVNVLITLFDPDHPGHGASRTWASAQKPLRWASCPITQNGFLRITSQPKYSNPIRIGMATQRLRAAIAATDHEFWPDDVSTLDDAVIDHRRLVGHRQITDAYLLALAVSRDARLATFAAMPFDAVVGARPEHVVVVGR